MYPQMGRSMVLGKGACHKRKRKLPLAEQERIKVLSSTEGPFRCTNCPQVKTEDKEGVKDDENQERPPNVFDSKEKFHAHVLECGGDLDWDPSAKKAKKEKKSKHKDAPARKIGKNLLITLRGAQCAV